MRVVVLKELSLDFFVHSLFKEGQEHHPKHYFVGVHHFHDVFVF